MYAHGCTRPDRLPDEMELEADLFLVWLVRKRFSKFTIRYQLSVFKTLRYHECDFYGDSKDEYFKIFKHYPSKHQRNKFQAVMNNYQLYLTETRNEN